MILRESDALKSKRSYCYEYVCLSVCLRVAPKHFSTFRVVVCSADLLQNYKYRQLSPTQLNCHRRCLRNSTLPSRRCQGRSWEFLRATAYTVCYSAYMPWQFRLSVRLSHGWISQKRLKLGLCSFHHTVAPSL